MVKLVNLKFDNIFILSYEWGKYIQIFHMKFKGKIPVQMKHVQVFLRVKKYLRNI